MNQGGGAWSHAVSNDLVHWHHVKSALSNDLGIQPCDGTVSFPDLGYAPFDGRAPVVMYGPDCGKPVPRPNASGAQVGTSDAPRVGTARAAVPTSPYLFNFDKPTQEAVTFDGIPCSFAGRVWKSKQAKNVWNMLCAQAAPSPTGGTGDAASGTSPWSFPQWAKYTSNSSDLLTWKLDPKPFVQTPDGKEAGLYPCSGPAFHRLPGAPPGGPTHILAAGCDGDTFSLGNYDSTKEVMTVTAQYKKTDVPSLGTWSQKMAYHWSATGREHPDVDPDTDSGRLFEFAWIAADGLGWEQSPSAMSLIRELQYDQAVGLKTYPVVEYAAHLRGATIVDEGATKLAAGAVKTLSLPHGAGGALDLLVSFAANSSKGGFGVAVRAPPGTTAGAALIVTVQDISDADAAGTRNATVVFTPPPTVVRLTPTNATYIAKKTVPVLAGESLTLRIMVDRPIVEVFFMGGRTSYVDADTPYSDVNASVHIFAGSASVLVEGVAAHSVGCGWSDTLPAPLKSDDRGQKTIAAAASPPLSFSPNTSNVNSGHSRDVVASGVDGQWLKVLGPSASLAACGQLCAGYRGGNGSKCRSFTRYTAGYAKNASLAGLCYGHSECCSSLLSSSLCSSLRSSSLLRAP